MDNLFFIQVLIGKVTKEVKVSLSFVSIVSMTGLNQPDLHRRRSAKVYPKQVNNNPHTRRQTYQGTDYPAYKPDGRPAYVSATHHLHLTGYRIWHSLFFSEIKALSDFAHANKMLLYALAA